jgi:hypothetical protein
LLKRFRLVEVGRFVIDVRDDDIDQAPVLVVEVA